MFPSLQSRGSKPGLQSCGKGVRLSKAPVPFGNYHSHFGYHRPSPTAGSNCHLSCSALVGVSLGTPEWAFLMGREPLLWAGDLLRSTGPPSQAPSYSTLGSHEIQSFYGRPGVSALGSFCNGGVTEAWPWPSLLRGLQRKNYNAVQ